MSKQLKIRPIYLGPGKMGSLSQAETHRRIKAMFARVQEKLMFEFRWLPTTTGSSRRIFFLDNAGMAALRSDGNPVLGQTKNGTIWLNSQRAWDKTIPVVQGAGMHEWLHSEGVGHSTDETSIMHKNLTVYYPSGKNWLWLANRFGGR
jgi:hypothetical protein